MTVAQERVDAYRERSSATPGLYLLAVHSALAAAVNAELLHHVRDNFLLDVDPARRLPLTPAVEAGMAQLLLSPLFREVGDGLWEMDPEVRSLLLADLAAIEDGQRIHDVAALLERYTRDESPWQDWPELREAQLVSAWAQLDPQAAEKWLADGSAQGSATGVDAGWFVAMRRKLDEAKRPVRAAEPEPERAPDLTPEEALTRYGPAAVTVVGFAGVRLTENGLLVVAAPTSVGDAGSLTVADAGRRTTAAVLLSADPERRLAFLVELGGPGRPAAPLDASPMPAGSPAYVIGSVPEPVVRPSTVLVPGGPSRLGRIAADAPFGFLVVSTDAAGGVVGLTQAAAKDGQTFTPSSAILDALADGLGRFFLRALEHEPARAAIDPDGWLAEGSRLLYDGGHLAAAARITVARAAHLANRGRLDEARAALNAAVAIAAAELDGALRVQVMELIEVATSQVLGEEPVAARADPGADLPAPLVALANEYEEIRDSQEPSGDRTRAMGSVVERMRGQTTPELLPALTASTDAGLRLAAVVALQDAPDIEWAEWLASRMEAEKPFVGYQASIALRNAAEYLPRRELPPLQEAMNRAEMAMASQPGTDRAAMLRVTAQILADRRRTNRTRRNKRLPFDWNLWDAGQTVRVRFLDGTPQQHQRVAKVAKEWLAQANLTFEFLPYPSTAPSHVRITFSQPGAWSYAGATARAIAQKEPTACIGPEFVTDPATFDYTIRRQFGHVLGLINEHQSPNADISWDTEAAYRAMSGPPNFWTRETIDHNLFQRYAIEDYRPFDPDSVMLWEIAPELVHGRKLGGKNRLSRSDVEFAGRLYPKRTPPA